MWKLSAAALCGLVAALAGCSKSGASSTVTGRVLYKGEPVKAGIVYFKSDQGEYYAQLRDNGTYTFNNLPTGTFTVVVDNETWNPEQKQQDYVKSKAGKKISAGMAKGFSEYDKMVGGGAMAGKGGAAEDTTTGPSKEVKEELTRLYVKLPKKYSHPKTSGLSYTVVGGEQTKDFELTD
ncbi:MAG: carboxypeptidase-like regulatory domain-containing protein [Gemmataceae bacterium]|nr:carboxypeptidase-like regulatory domain-containing protein [Gemmataceae bacterium]